MWTAEHVALPVLAALDTERARQFELVQPAERPDAVFAIPSGSGITPTEAARGATLAGGATVPNWSAPVGVLFLLPAMFLLVAFPARPFWLWLLGYHVAIGLVAFAVFAVGLAAFEPAFGLYVFTRTYVTETVSLVVPLLLALAGGRTGGQVAR